MELKHSGRDRSVEVIISANKKIKTRKRVSFNLLQTKRNLLYRVIHKSLRDFRTRLRNNQERHGRKEHINRYKISPSFFFVLGALAYFQVPPLGGSSEKKNGVHSE